jgi:hypothetical protein
MEKPVTTPDTPAIRLVEKPQSKWMSLLNGAGNGAMVGGSLLVANNIFEHIKKPEGKSPFFLIATGATGICTAIGAMYGLREAKQVNDYRTALAKDIETLHAQIDGIDPKIQR